MAISSQSKLSLMTSSSSSFQTKIPKTHINIIRYSRARCSTIDTTTESKTEPNRTSSRGLDDPTLASTWSHRAWVVSGSATILASLARAVSGHVWLETALASLAGYLAADLASGVYHWGIDNYGDTSTPFFGSQVEAFQGHHKRPKTIARREFANNLHALGRATTFAVLPIDLMVKNPTLHGFVWAFAGCVMFSQQFHAWAHSDRARIPGPAATLQGLGLLVSRAKHGAHHRLPYNTNYCIVSGVWNEILDSFLVFQTIEMVLFFKLGVRPRSWTEPNSDWTEET